MKYKVCPTCRIEKTIDMFARHNKRKDNVRSECKECEAIRSKNYTRTKDGLVTRIYAHQKSTSKKRNHPAPSYTKDELKEWLFSQKLFHHLHHLWRISGYDKMLKPSIDRIDDYEHYNFSNIQLMTWQQNNDKGMEDLKNGNNTKQSRTIFQFDLDGNFIAEYHSLQHAGRVTGANVGAICWVARGHKKTHHGFIWKYEKETA